MSSIGTGYDLSAAQFSPDGRVFQVEYAIKAVENSSTAVGIRGKDGVVLGVEKLITSKLHEASSNKRIFTVDRHIGIAISGLIADARRVVDRAKGEAARYRMDYSQPITSKHLMSKVSGYMHLFTLYNTIRPLGCSLIMGSYGPEGPTLYMADPSGVSWGYNGVAVGKAKQAAKTELEKLKMKDMTCRELVNEVAKIIYTVHDEVKDKDFELELSWVGEVSGGVHEMVPQGVKEEAERYAKEALEDDDSDDDD